MNILRDMGRHVLVSRRAPLLARRGCARECSRAGARACLPLPCSFLNLLLTGMKVRITTSKLTAHRPAFLTRASQQHRSFIMRRVVRALVTVLVTSVSLSAAASSALTPQAIIDWNILSLAQILATGTKSNVRSCPRTLHSLGAPPLIAPFSLHLHIQAPLTMCNHAPLSTYVYRRQIAHIGLIHVSLSLPIPHNNLARGSSPRSMSLSTKRCTTCCRGKA